MNVRFASKISEEELDRLPVGAIVSFGSFCIEKNNQYVWTMTSQEADMDVMDTREVYRLINGMMTICPEYRRVSIITDNDKNYGCVWWSEEDIINALSINGFETTQKNTDAVWNALDEEDLRDNMVSTGWAYIYDKIWEIREDLSQQQEAE